MKTLDLPLSNVFPTPEMLHITAEQWLFRMTVDNGVYTSERLNTLALQPLALIPHKISSFLQLFHPDSFCIEMSLEKESREFATPLYYSFLTGLAEVTPVLLKMDPDINAQGGLYGTPLRRLHLEVTRRLSSCCLMSFVCGAARDDSV